MFTANREEEYRKGYISAVGVTWLQSVGRCIRIRTHLGSWNVGNVAKREEECRFTKEIKGYIAIIWNKGSVTNEAMWKS